MNQRTFSFDRVRLTSERGLLSRSGLQNREKNDGNIARPTRHFHKWRLGVLLCLIITVVMVGIGFNVGYYPFYRLQGVEREQYREALTRAAKGFAVSESLQFEKCLRSEFRELEGKGSAYAWGVFALATHTHEKINLWVALEWSPFWNSWFRTRCQWLADPRDRIFFAESQLKLGNFKKMFSLGESVYREELRRLREVRHTWGLGKAVISNRR